MGTLTRLGVRLALLLVIAALVLHLARRPLAERWLRPVVERELAALLGGSVRVAGLASVGLTRVAVGRLEWTSADGVCRVAGGPLRAWIDPLALARGAPGGLRALALRLEQVDVTVPEAGPGSAPASPAAEVVLPLPGGLLDLLPEGAVLEIARLALRRGAYAFAGPARLELRPAGAGHARELEFRVPAASGWLRVQADGRVEVHASVRDPRRVLPLAWPEAPPIECDAVHGMVETHLGRPLAARGTLEVRGLRAAEIALPRAAIDVELASGAVRVDLRPELRTRFAAAAGRATLQVRAGTGTRADLDLALAGGGRVQARAGVDPAGDWPRNGHLELRAEGLPLGMLPAASRLPELAGETDLALEWRDGVLTAELAARLRASAARLGTRALDLRVQARGDARGLGLSARLVDPELGVAAATVACEGPGVAELVAEPRRLLAAPATLDARAECPELARLAPLLPAELALSGRGVAAFSARGTLADPRPSVVVEVRDARVALSGTAEVRDLWAAVHGTLERVTAEGGGAALDGAALAFRATLDPRAGGVRELWTAPPGFLGAPLHGSARLAGIDLAAQAARLGGVEDLRGRADVDLALAGTLAHPRPELVAHVRGAELKVPDLPRIEGLEATIAADPARIEVRALRGSLGAGTVAVSGTVTGAPPLWNDPRAVRCDLRLTGQEVLLLRRPGLRVRSDLDLALQGPLPALQISGDVRVRSARYAARIPYLDLRGGGAAPLPGIRIAGPTLPPPLAAFLDLQVDLSQPLAVDTNVFRGAIAGALRVHGPLHEPVLEGTLTTADARLILPGASLQVGAGTLRFTREAPAFPQVDVQATGRRAGVDVTLGVRGRFDAPEVLLGSQPPLPAPDLVVLLTTGVLPEQVRSDPAGRLGAVMGGYVVEGIADYFFGPDAGEARESFVDRLHFESGTELSSRGNPNLLLEYRIRDRFYLQAERDAYDDYNAGLVYRVRFR